MHAEMFIALCVCGEAKRAQTLGAVTRWAEWHSAIGVEGCDHVVWVGYDPPASAVHIRKGKGGF